MTMTRRSSRAQLAVAVSLATVLMLGAARDAASQGTLSTQGLGFPPGQLSTRSLSMGGAIGESDPLSPLNPAAIGLLASPIILMQAEPEYRELRIGGTTQRTSVARFPLFMGGLPLGQRWTVSASASTLLDRTWATSTRDSQVVGPDTIAETRRQRSDGSIADLRLAVAFSAASWLKIGVAGHALSGRDFLSTIRSFDDTNRFTPNVQESTISFGGNALSVGVQTLWPRKGAIGVSYRRGGKMNAYLEDKVVGSGSAPDHFGASAVYLGISGTALAVRAAKDSWSKLDGVSKDLNIHEGWDIGVGGDVSGPRLGGSSLAVRVGARWRTLPFSESTSAAPVKERALSGGFSLPMGRNGVELNMGLIRAARTGAAGVSERSWTISTGFSVRP